MTACDHCHRSDGHNVTPTSVGRLCVRCTAYYLARDELPPLTEQRRQRRGWPFTDDHPSDAP